MRCEKNAVDKSEAYRRGQDYARRGATIFNCHFSIFSSRTNTAEWERGAADEKAQMESGSCEGHPLPQPMLEKKE